jgi:hypothetical protein
MSVDNKTAPININLTKKTCLLEVKGKLKAKMGKK